MVIATLPFLRRRAQAIKLKASGLAADPLKYQNAVSAGFGLWLDYDRPKNGWNTDKGRE